MLLDSAFGFRHKQKKLKDHEEYILKTNIISESNKLKSQLATTQEKMNTKNEELATKYKKSEIKEKELKDYITTMNKKLFTTNISGNEIYDKINALHNEIINMITVIQEKVRIQINVTRDEMEKEVADKFNEAERKQKDLMNQKMEEQKKVFDRMNYTKGELEKIRKRFVETNNQCESLIRKNEKLKVELDATKKTNDTLELSLIALQKEHNKVEQDYNELIKENPLTVSNTEMFLQSFDKDSPNPHSKVKGKFNTTSNKIFHTDNSKSGLIRTMKENIEHVKQDYNKAYRSFVECQKEKTEAQQLLQKCIEDVSIQLNSVHSKMIGESVSVNSMSYQNYKEAEKNLERKLKILTFVYDNGLQNLKVNKSKTLFNINQ